MRISPIAVALRALGGAKTLHGCPLPAMSEAAATLRCLTGQDFGEDAAAWGAWLRANRWAYHAQPDDPRLMQRPPGAVAPLEL